MTRSLGHRFGRFFDRGVKTRLGGDMMGIQMLPALTLLYPMGTADCRQAAESPDQWELPFMSDQWHRASGQTSDARRQVRQGEVGPQERAQDYRAVAAWSSFLLLVGAGAFALGMVIHNEAIAQQHTPRPAPIYYCATGVEMPAFEPCKKVKSQRDI